MKKFKPKGMPGAAALYVALDRDLQGKETSMSASSIQEWQGVLQDIAEQKRHRLTGSEYKEVIAAIEAQPKDIESQHIARQLVAKLAQHQGHDPKLLLSRSRPESGVQR